MGIYHVAGIQQALARSQLCTLFMEFPISTVSSAADTRVQTDLLTDA